MGLDVGVICGGGGGGAASESSTLWKAKSPVSILGLGGMYAVYKVYPRCFELLGGRRGLKVGPCSQIMAII